MELKVSISAIGVENPSSKSVFYIIDNTTNAIENCNAIYDPALNTYSFTTTHNSKYAILPINTSLVGATGTINTDTPGTYEATFELPENKPFTDATYDSYIVDFILTLNSDDKEFSLVFDGETFKANSNPTAIKVENYSYNVDSQTTFPIYFSDIYNVYRTNHSGDVTGDNPTLPDYNSTFTLSNVFGKGAGGKAVAKISDIKSLDNDANVTVTMVMYQNDAAKQAGNYIVLSNTVIGEYEYTQTGGA